MKVVSAVVGEAVDFEGVLRGVVVLAGLGEKLDAIADAFGHVLEGELAFVYELAGDDFLLVLARPEWGPRTGLLPQDILQEVENGVLAVVEHAAVVVANSAVVVNSAAVEDSAVAEAAAAEFVAYLRENTAISIVAVDQRDFPAAVPTTWPEQFPRQ